MSFSDAATADALRTTQGAADAGQGSVPVSQPTRIRVLIADDHPVVRTGLTLMLQYEPDMEPIGEACNGLEAVTMHRAHRPDITLMDLRMPDMDGIRAISEIRRDAPAARVILLTTYDGDEGIFSGLRAGAQAYLLKDAPCEEILDTVRKVHAGKKCITMAVGNRLAERAAFAELTDRELEVLRQMARGMSNIEIGTALFIAEGTVKFHVNHILNKLDVSDRTQAVILALKRGLASLG